MEAKRTKQQVIDWLKAAIIVENRNPLLTDITADFDQTAVSLTNKPSE